jgi:hypothetical protein
VEIIANTRPDAIVETGTFLGVTTELLSETGLPVFSIELHPRNYGFVRARFGAGGISSYPVETVGRPCVGFSMGLCTLCLAAQFSFTLIPTGMMICRLRQINIVFTRCPLAVVMIDDFEVPSDAGYGYDDYGPEKAVVSGYISAVLAHQLQAFYPSTPSAADYPSAPLAAAGLAAIGGVRRGCIVLAKKVCHGPALTSIPFLRPPTEAELESTSNITGFLLNVAKKLLLHCGVAASSLPTSEDFELERIHRSEQGEIGR